MAQNLPPSDDPYVNVTTYDNSGRSETKSTACFDNTGNLIWNTKLQLRCCTNWQYINGVWPRFGITTHPGMVKMKIIRCIRLRHSLSTLVLHSALQVSCPQGTVNSSQVFNDPEQRLAVLHSNIYQLPVAYFCWTTNLQSTVAILSTVIAWLQQEIDILQKNATAWTMGHVNPTRLAFVPPGLVDLNASISKES